MNSKRLKDMISVQPGGMKAFSAKIGIPNTTLHDRLVSNDKLSCMKIDDFLKVAHGLGYTADQLIDILEQ